LASCNAPHVTGSAGFSISTRLDFARRRPFSEAGHHVACPTASNPTAIARNVVAALNFGENSFIYTASASTVKGPDVIEFLDSLIQQGDGRPTVIVLDNASVHHSIDQHTLDRWFLEHKALLFYLPPYSPELNLIEIVWKHMKYHWRRFVTWTKETIDAELAALLSGYGTKFQINFS
jgi:transposase